MPVYEYIALDRKGKEHKGIISADSGRMVQDSLRRDGLYPRRIDPLPAQSAPSLSGWRSRLFNRVNSGDLVVAIRQLATLLSAGIPLASCLDSVLQQVKKGGLYRTLAQIRERINEGSSLAAAMEEQRQAFPPTYAAMVRAGESSGTLELVLERLADFGEQQESLKRKLQSSLAYPALILLVSLGVVFFLMSYVVPKVTQIFLDFEQALPLPTIILIQISEVFHAYWWVVPLLLAAAGLALKRMASSSRGRPVLDAWLLRMPLLGSLLHHIVLSRYCHTLGTLLKNEVALLQALKIVRNVVSNSLVQQATDRIIKEVSEGSSLAKPMARGTLFPPTMVQLVSAGEQSGQLDAMFLKVAQNSENYVSNRLTALTSLLEPVMILVLGGIVGFVVLAVLLPIFDMSQLIR
ncbi:type II secretion system inner membrane protein GspF [Desulfovermiculus halophilus]|jgi:general secretion pathway protein F|uniref:type II secretion system inner membrane protein GspF n=1 Tax=Desulfovermiculus halophilus TaxID=339722 RepID=UPI00048623D1|nr:type II secretion system inner membrane protein GspF [Desulfovermiculus halophilus]